MAAFERTTPFGSSSHQPGNLLTCTRPVAPVSSSTRARSGGAHTMPSRFSPTRSRISHIKCTGRRALANRAPPLPLGDVPATSVSRPAALHQKGAVDEHVA